MTDNTTFDYSVNTEMERDIAISFILRLLYQAAFHHTEKKCHNLTRSPMKVRKAVVRLRKKDRICMKKIFLSLYSAVNIWQYAPTEISIS